MYVWPLVLETDGGDRWCDRLCQHQHSRLSPSIAAMADPWKGDTIVMKAVGSELYDSCHSCD